MHENDKPLPTAIHYLNVPQKRKRSPRAAIACEACRFSKSKCDQGQPCRVCARHSLECLYRQKKQNRSNSIAGQSDHPSGPRGREVSAVSNVAHLESKERRRSITTGEIPSRSKDAFRPVVPRPHVVPRIVDLSSSLVDDNRKHEQCPKTKTSERGVSESPTEDSEGFNLDEPAEETLSPNGFGEVNKSTNGTEFYGPTATLAFLLELRSRARSFQSQPDQPEKKQTRGSFGSNGARRLSIVNFFHNSDNDVSDNLDTIQESPDNSGPYNGLMASSPASSIASHYPPPNTEVEKECIQLFFANLHLVYFFLDKKSFLESCQRLIWSSDLNPPKRHGRQGASKFSALYNAVVAVGAITAGDDAVAAPKVQEFLQARARQRVERQSSKRSNYPPLELAQIYFAKAKALLGDLFEVCSLESTQTLFLMSIFCQYALKPHGAYMYSGMATRTASSIGIANEPDLTKNPIQGIRTWWCMYYHEMEVCCSLGRETFLRRPAHYAVFFGQFPDPLPSAIASANDRNVFFARSMTELAYILKRSSEEIYHAPASTSQIDKSLTALNLDRALLQWKAQLSPLFDLTDTPLTEPESVTKRKIVLKLRFYSARILIHRPFLVAAAYQSSSPTPSPFSENIQHCLSSSRETIHLLYDTFMNRPFFRTWWYNTTYAFNAITIILYVLVSHLQKGSSEELLGVVEKSLKIFQAMDGIAVARRCAELTQEIFDVAKQSVQAQTQNTNLGATLQSNNISKEVAQLPLDMQLLLNVPEEDAWGGMDGVMQNDFFASLASPNILDSFGANLAGLDMDLAEFENVDFFRDFGN